MKHEDGTNVNTVGCYAEPVANSKPVGPQGQGGAIGGAAVAGVSNPRGIEPKSIGGGCQIVQMPVQPKVGK